MRKTLIIFSFILVPYLSVAQSDYYATEERLIMGVELKPGSEKENAIAIRVKDKESERFVSYNPYEIVEYGLRDGRVYFSKEIESSISNKRVFMQRIYDGEMKIYYYRGADSKTFYFESDSIPLTAIPRKNEEGQKYNDFLIQLTQDCDKVKDAAKLVMYNAASMAEFFNRYENCEEKPFPHFKLGLKVGYDQQNVNPDFFSYAALSQLNYSYNGSFTAGFFIESPTLVRNLSMQTGAYYVSHAYSYFETLDEFTDIDFVMNYSTLRIPFVVRYYFPINVYRPFLSGGLLWSYHFENEHTVHESSRQSDGSMLIEELDYGAMVTDSDLGLQAGLGIEYDLDFRRSIFLEVNYGYQFGVSDNISTRSIVITTLLGISF